MNTQIFNLIQSDLNGHKRSQNATFMFILTLTYVLMDICLCLLSIHGNKLEAKSSFKIENSKNVYVESKSWEFPKWVHWILFLKFKYQNVYGES